MNEIQAPKAIAKCASTNRKERGAFVHDLTGTKEPQDRLSAEAPWKGETFTRFRELTQAQQEQAVARFFDAGPDDQRIYVIDGHGDLYARKLGRHPERKRKSHH